MAFREGFKLPIFDTGEIGKIGLMLGWDLAFPEVARAMTLDGAEIICVMANWETSYIDEWKTYVRSRAYENAVFMAAANRVGEDITMKFGGESMIIGPRGRVFASMEQESLPKPEQLKLDGKPESTAIAASSGDGANKPAEGSTPVAAPATDGNGKAAETTPAVSSSVATVSKQLPIIAPVVVVQQAEGCCVARIDLDEVRRYREEFQTLQTRQPGAYRAVVRKY